MARRRMRVGVAAGAVTAVVAGVWLAVGLDPRLEQGYVSWASEAVDQSDAGAGWTALDPAPGDVRIMASYRSTGPVPVRVAAVPGGLLVTSSYLTLVEESATGVPDPSSLTPDDPATVVTVPRGRTVAVWQVLDLPCATLDADSGMGIDRVVLDVTTLGITRRVELPLAEPVVLRTSTDRSCSPD